MGLLDWWYLDSADVDAGKRLDAQKAELDRKAFEDGKISGAEYERRQMADAPNLAGTYGDQVVEAFDDGWDTGKKRVADTIEGTVRSVSGTAADVLSGPLAGIAKGLPWWAWIVGGVALLAWAGLLPGVVAGLRSALKK